MFGYGSLMWKIDFPTVRKVIGYVEGYVRTMEWADEVHRGVPKQKSRTAAIFESDNPHDRVYGVVYEISQDYWDRVLKPNVSFRERGGYGVKEVRFVPFDSGATNVPEKIMVTLFLGDKESDYYMPGTTEQLAKHIVKAVGNSGTNLEYLYSTAEALRMIMPPGATDKHMFDLEAAARKLEILMKPKGETHFKHIADDDKYEKRRKMLRLMFKAVDNDIDGDINVKEFSDLTENILGLKPSTVDIKTLCEEIDKNKDGKIHFNEFLEYLLVLMNGNCEKDFKKSFWCQTEGPTKGSEAVGHALLTYELLQDAGIAPVSERGFVNLPTLKKDNAKLLEQMYDGVNTRARDVLDFFFPDNIQDAMDLWFKKSKENDKKIKEQFTDLVEEALAGKLDDWVSTPTECLALAILLNQFPRNIYRKKPEMYSGDEKAQGIAIQALFYGYWKSLTPLQIAFLPCIILCTAENLHYQELGYQIWTNYIKAKLPVNHPLHKVEFIFEQNMGIIKDFGRFPHRNKTLKRASTEAEDAYLKKNAARLPNTSLIYENGKFIVGEAGAEAEDEAWPDLDFTTKIQTLEISA